MAIQTNYTTKQGIVLSNAYFRLEHLRIIRELQGELDPNNSENDARTHRYLVRMRVHVYQQNPGKQGTSIEDIMIDSDLPTIESQVGDTFVDKAYSWLMTQEQFNGAQGV